MTTKTHPATPQPLTFAQVKKILAKVPKDKRKATMCSLVGHSLIVEGCFGYVHCARCDAQVGDQLMSGYGQAADSVRVGHNCPTCRANYKKLGWRHKYLAPNPFAKKAGAA